MSEEAGGLLVLVDGSETGRRALDVAVERARDKDLSLTLLAIVPPRLWRARQAQFQTSGEKHDEEFARELLAQAHRTAKQRGVHANERLRSGAPADVIVEEAARGFDAIVIGERRNLVGAPGLVSIVRGRLTIGLEVVEEDASS